MSLFGRATAVATVEPCQHHWQFRPGIRAGRWECCACPETVPATGPAPISGLDMCGCADTDDGEKFSTWLAPDGDLTRPRLSKRAKRKLQRRRVLDATAA
jgi:hypothetical protein